MINAALRMERGIFLVTKTTLSTATPEGVTNYSTKFAVCYNMSPFQSLSRRVSVTFVIFLNGDIL